MIEDSSDDAALIAAQLERGGFKLSFKQIWTEAALHEALDEPWDIILSDYSMPQFSGPLALDILRASGRDIPFIMVSGNIGDDIAVACMKAGASDYLMKDNLRRLAPAVERELVEAARRREARRREEGQKLLDRLTQQLASSIDYQKTKRCLIDALVPALADCCIIDVRGHGKDRHQEEIKHVDPRKEEQLREIRRLYPSVARTGHPIEEVFSSHEVKLVKNLKDERLESLAQDTRHLKMLREVAIDSAIILPLMTQGNCIGILTIGAHGRLFDDTDRRLIEELVRRSSLALDNARLYREAKEANRLKDEFLAAVSHELRTPLNAIVGHSDLISQGIIEPGELAESLEAIHRNALIQQRLVEDLLDISMIINGKMPIELRLVGLEDLIRKAIASMEMAAKLKDVAIELTIEGSLGSGTIDPTRIQQIIWNLLSNAVKFSKREGRVQVRARRSDERLELTVSDRGKGIEPGFLPYVFERFRQEDGSSTRQHGGLGIGLAITRHLVEMHGGTISVASGGPGQGASFTVRLPLPQGESPQLKSGEAQQEMEGILPRALANLRILVLDDDADARNLLWTILTRAGARVSILATPEQAFQSIDRVSYDAFLCDIGMPEEDGYSLISRIREREKSEQREPLLAIAVTSFANPSDRERALKRGFQAYIAKPVSVPHMLVTIREATRKRGG